MGYAKVRDFDSAIGSDQKIRRLDITMNDALVMHYVAFISARSILHIMG
jgi:hypothetical protein